MVNPLANNLDCRGSDSSRLLVSRGGNLRCLKPTSVKQPWDPSEGLSLGTRIIDCCWCTGPEKLVFPMRMKSLHSGRMAPVIHLAEVSGVNSRH